MDGARSGTFRPDSPQRLLFQGGNDLRVHVDAQVEFESEALLGGVLQRGGEGKGCIQNTTGESFQAH